MAHSQKWVRLETDHNQMYSSARRANLLTPHPLQKTYDATLLMLDQTDSREEELQIWHKQQLISKVSAACLEEVKVMSSEVSSVRCLSSDSNAVLFWVTKPCVGLETLLFFSFYSKGSQATRSQTKPVNGMEPREVLSQPYFKSCCLDFCKRFGSISLK